MNEIEYSTEKERQEILDNYKNESIPLIEEKRLIHGNFLVFRDKLTVSEPTLEERISAIESYVNLQLLGGL